MALSAANRIMVYEIVGLPPDTSEAVITTTLAHVPVTQIGAYSPTFTKSDISSLVTAIDAALADISTENQTRVEGFIASWNDIGSTSPMVLTEADNGVKGTIVDHESQRNLIRTRVGNLVGIYVPPGGWIMELQRMFGGMSWPHNGGGRY